MCGTGNVDSHNTGSGSAYSNQIFSDYQIIKSYFFLTSYGSNDLLPGKFSAKFHGFHNPRPASVMVIVPPTI